MIKFGEAVWVTFIGLFVLLCITAIGVIATEMGWWALMIPVVLGIAWMVGRLTLWALEDLEARGEE